MMPTPTISMIPHSEDWSRGFEAGIAYAFMVGRYSRIVGIYQNLNEEDLFLMAHRLGYAWTWKKGPDGHTAIEFNLIEAQRDDEE